MIPVFFGATLLVYALVFLLPGDPIAALSGQRQLPPGVAAQLRHQYHLDQSFIVQYLIYLKGIVTGNFGTSYSGRPVSEVMAQAFPVTIRLALLALLFEAVFGIGAGLIAGLRRGGFFDATLLVASLIVIAVPIFVIGFVVQIVFGVKLGWINPTVGPEATWSELIVPALVLGSVSFAYVLRLTRDSVSENLSADWVRTATAKGLSRRQVVTTHVLRNSLIPVVTFLGADLGALMGGAIITEGIFNIPGVGHALYQAIIRGEGPTVVSIVTVLVIIYIITSLLVDLLYAVLDPRIRYV
jgi:oligopeptide transport system permease protein